ncbi:Transposable element Tc3 transposase [Araneus ventricosus]|uniref:Transposable element Tc3 transposase n=1 Tax=Araneus ventricosus TaxID=182803 RepID=A0A4Y2BLI9_ARAVE|nr:Transposable element Tc3 transposase [Araneus ventricosus]
MPKALQLSNEEVSKILHLKLLGKTVKEISKLLNHSKSMIYRAKTPYEPKPCSGRPRVTDIRSVRRIERMASSQKMSVQEITRASRLQISKNTVHRRIIEPGYMVHEKWLADYHSQSFTLVRDYNGLVIICHMVINVWLSFSVIKKWNFDGPDGNIKYWHDLLKETRSVFSRQSGGGSVMVWTAFGFSGQVGLAFLDGRQNSPKYIETLENHLIPFAENIGGRNWEYQHDNAPIHTSNATKNHLNLKSVTAIKWPQMSPDLNPIENVWGMMSRKVYENGGQLYSVNALKTAIETAWYNLEPKILQTLIISMEKRVYDVILKIGKTLNY